VFEELRKTIIVHEKLLYGLIPFAAIFAIFLNSTFLRVSVVGGLGLAVYLFVSGEILGRVFFNGEKPFFKFVLGLFAFCILMALTGVLALLVFQLEMWYLLGMIFAAVVTLFLNQFFAEYKRPRIRTGAGRMRGFKVSYLAYGFYMGMLLLSFFLLFDVRSGWVRGPIWNVIPPVFLPIYFYTTAILVGIVLFSENNVVRLLLIIMHCTFSLLFIVIVSYPGIILYDPWYDLGRARSLLYSRSLVSRAFSFGLGSAIRFLNSFMRGVSSHVLIVTFADVLSVDMYWTYVFLAPVLWGFFAPVTSYKIARKIGGSKTTSIVAAFLTLSNLYFLGWGKLTEASSLGILFIFLLLYLVLHFLSSSESKRIYVLIFITLATLAVTHFLAAVMAVSILVLAFAFKKYEHIQTKFSSNFLLLICFIFSVFMLPLAEIARGILLPMLGTTAFNVDKMLSNDIWSLIFGFSAELDVQEALLREVFPILGMIGLAYALQKKKKFNKTLCLFSFFALAVTMIDYRIMKYGMVNHIFGPGRIKVFTDMFAVTFVAVVVKSAAEFLLGSASQIRAVLRWKRVLGGTLICLCLSSWVTLAIHETYKSYTEGLLPTSLEVLAVEYIDEHTEGKYVVLAPHRTAVISWGFIGIPNPTKKYVSLGIGGNPTNPSVADMYEYMGEADADVGYFMISALGGGDVDRRVAEASEIFGLFKVLSDENGEIYIFNYKIPPLPKDGNVTAFYWDTPPTYYIQNDLVRVIVNPETSSLDLRDFWGSLYESVKLNETLVDGSPLGNLTSIEYFAVAKESWVEWTSDVEIPPNDQFDFKLQFEGESLVVTVERDKPSVELQWESGHQSTWDLEFGDFNRIHVPGLIDGKDSYDVFSREYGFLYTTSITENVTFSPIDAPDMNRSALAYPEILEHCKFNLTESRTSYSLYVKNNAVVDQWAFVEVWLPDEVYVGTFPPLQYSRDAGKTWVYVPYSLEAKSNVPIRTIGGIDINWVFTIPRSRKENPTMWWSHTKASGGKAPLPESYSDSGGAQNRMFFGFYLPAKDKILVKLGCSVYYVRPLKLTYAFVDSENVMYGVRNMESGLVGVFRLGPSEYTGGFASTTIPTSLAITQDENDNVRSLLVALSSFSALSLLSAKDVDTRTEIPDFT